MDNPLWCAMKGSEREWHRCMKCDSFSRRMPSFSFIYFHVIDRRFPGGYFCPIKFHETFFSAEFRVKLQVY